MHQTFLPQSSFSTPVLVLRFMPLQYSELSYSSLSFDSFRVLVAFERFSLASWIVLLRKYLVCLIFGNNYWEPVYVWFIVGLALLLCLSFSIAVFSVVIMPNHLWLQLYICSHFSLHKHPLLALHSMFSGCNFNWICNESCIEKPHYRWLNEQKQIKKFVLEWNRAD